MKEIAVEDVFTATKEMLTQGKEKRMGINKELLEIWSALSARARCV